MSSDCNRPEEPTEAQKQIIAKLNDETRKGHYRATKLLFTHGLTAHLEEKTDDLLSLMMEHVKIRKLVANCPIIPSPEPCRHGQRPPSEAV